MKVIILGGGLSGLSCAAAIARNGHEAVVIEKESEVGGLARSFRTNGYVFDYGPHLLFGPKVIPLLNEILAPDLALIPVKRDLERMYFGHRYFKFPFDPKDLLLNMERKRIPAALSRLLLKNILRNADHSAAKNVEDWVIRKVGKPLYDYTSLAGYIEKLYGIPPSEVSTDWAIQKLKFLGRLEGRSLFSLALKAFGEEKKLQSQVVHYPTAGIDQLAANIAKSFKKLGGIIYLDSESECIEKKNNGVVVHFLRDGRERTTEGDFLVSTIPVTRLIRMLEPLPPKNIASTAKFLKYRTLLLLFLCTNKEQMLDYQCIYFTENDVPFRRVTEFKNLSSSMAPNGKSSLCVEITCSETDPLAMSTDYSLYSTIVGELKRRSLLEEEDIERYFVLRIPYAYPIYNIGYHSFLEQVLDYLTDCTTIISIGRQGLFHYNNMSNSILSSYRVGQALSNAGKDKFRDLINQVYKERTGKYMLI